MIDVARSFLRRVELAWGVFRADPDDVVTLKESDDGTVHFQNQFMMGIALTRTGALNAVSEVYREWSDGDE